MEAQKNELELCLAIFSRTKDSSLDERKKLVEELLKLFVDICGSVGVCCDLTFKLFIVVHHLIS